MYYYLLGDSRWDAKTSECADVKQSGSITENLINVTIQSTGFIIEGF